MTGILWRKNNTLELNSQVVIGVVFSVIFAFLFLLLPNISYGATEFVSIIDPDNGDTTDYTSLSAWESAVQTDLTATTTLVFSVSSSTGTTTDGVTITGQTSGATGTVLHLASSSEQILIENISGTFQNGEVISTGYGTSTITATGTQAIAVAQCRSTGGTADTNVVTIDGWTTSSTTYIKIWTDPTDPYGRHNGKWFGGYQRTKGVYIHENYVRIDGLSVKTNSKYDRSYFITSSTGGGEIYISNSLGWNAYYDSDAPVFDVWNVDNLNIYFWNNIAKNDSNDIAITINDPDPMAYLYGNTAISENAGGIVINSGNNNTYLVNNIAISENSSAISGTPALANNNISNDDTADNWGGYGNKINQTVQFLDTTNHDFHLSPDDTSARNAGTSSPLTDSNLSFYTDIDDTTRGSAWDIGADEVPAEFVSTICENTSAGGDCADMDYNTLSSWEDAVETDLTATSTRVFSGTLTGSLSENNLVYFIENGTSTGSGYVVATTSDSSQGGLAQILIDGITSSSSLPLMSVASGTKITYDASNYFTVSGATTTDELGASPMAIAKIDGAWANADTNRVEINGWDTDNDNYIKVYTTGTARHKGKWDDNKYRISINNTGSDSDSGIVNWEHYTRIDGIQIDYNHNSISSYGYGIRLTVGESNSLNSKIYVSNNIVKGSVSNGRAVGIAVLDALPETKIYNNIVYGFTKDDTQLGSCIMVDGDRSYAYNNTLFNCIRGIFRKGYFPIISNNIIASTTDPFYSTFHASSTNNASDTTDTPTGGSNTITNATINFVSVASGTEDFHLDMSKDNSDIVNAGADLSNDIGLSGIDKIDIDSALRNPDDKGWDIGADETPAKQYRSVGNTSGDISNGGTITISSTTRTAIFSTAQPDNVGVGDVIQYGGAGYYKLAFIISRASSTEYGVQAYDTTAPSATTTASMQIFRAHLLLDDWEDQVAGDVNAGIDSTVEDQVLVNQDLTASNTTMMVSAYASDSGDTEEVSINGWTTGAQNYIKVYTPVDSDEVGITQRHSGKWDDGKYWLNSDGGINIWIRSAFVRIDGLQLSNPGAASSRNIYANATAEQAEDAQVYISNNIVKGGNDRTLNRPTGIQLYNFSKKGEFYIYNNIIYDFQGTGVYALGIDMDEPEMDVYVYNNTVNNCHSGILSYNGGAGTYVLAFNNLVQNSDYRSYYLTFDPSSDYNISNDSISPGGAHDKTDTVVKFIDETNKNFHLSPDDTSAIDVGTSSVIASIGEAIQYDIDGNYRRTWDIGADEASIDFVTTVEENGNGDFTTLASWEDGVDSDIAATTTAVFSITGDTGTFTPGNIFVGQTSNATGTLVNIGSSSDQILLSNIEGAFISGEKIADGYGTTTLSDAGNPANAVAKIDGNWSSPDTTAVTIDGWTTGPNNHIRIYTTDTARHNGKWDEGKYRLENTSNLNPGYVVGVSENYVRFNGLQIYAQREGYPRDGFYLNPGVDSYIYIYNSIFRANFTGSNSAERSGIFIQNIYKSNTNYYIYNNIIYDWNDGDSRYSGIRANYPVNVYLYNNVLYNNYFGVYRNSGTIIAKNNIVYNNTTDYYGTFDSSSDHNISSDSTAPGAHSKTNATVSFLDADNDDFHLSTTDTVAKDAGVALSDIVDCRASLAMTNFACDIDGNSRYDIGWDIGADEAPTILYRSVGLHSNDLNVGGETVDIIVATNTATAIFSGNITSVIGVGDAIEYGSPLSLAFITGRTSSSTYSIQSATGTAPIATTSAVASIYRAHEHLDDWEDQVSGDVNQSIDAGLQSDVLVNQDLVASNTAMFVPCYASTSADTLAVTVDGWTTATTSYIKIYTPKDTDEVGITQRHNGVWSDDAYRMIGHDVGISAREEYIKLDGLQFEFASTSVDYPEVISILDSNFYLSNSIIRSADLSGYIESRGVSSVGGINNVNIWNNIIYGFGADVTVNDGYGIRMSSNANIYNNTVYNCNKGIRSSGAVINNVAFNNDDDFYSSGGMNYNASDDLDGTNAIDISPGAVEADDWSKAFKDYVNYDFHIKNTSSVLYNAGTSTDLVTDDIAGNARPFAGYFDIGAFEHTPLGQIRMRGNVKMRGTIKIR